MATQAYGLELETTAENINAEGEHSSKKVEELQCSDSSTQPMQDAEESLGVEADPDFFAAPTMACDLADVAPDVSKVPDDTATESEGKSTTENASESTQVFDTVPVERSMKGDDSDSTQAFDTVPVEKKTEGEVEEPTQAFETVPIGQESPGKPSLDKCPVKLPANKSVEQTMILSNSECPETVLMDNEEGVESESEKLKVKGNPQPGTAQVIEDDGCADDGMTDTGKDITVDDDATQAFAEEGEVDGNSGKTGTCTRIVNVHVLVYTLQDSLLLLL